MKNLCPVGAFPPAYVYAITQIKHKKKALLEAAFAKVSNMTFYPYAYEFVLSRYCVRKNKSPLPGDADILQILRALRSDGSAACGDTPSCTDLDNIVDLSLGQQRLLP